MFFELTESQEELRSIVRSFLEEARPQNYLVRLVEGRCENESDLDLHRRLCTELDVLGAAIPECRGGSGAGLVELFLVFSELGRVLYGGPFLSSLIAAEVLLHNDPGRAHDDLLRSIITGQVRCTVASLNDDRSSLIANHREGIWTVSGPASFVFDAPSAHMILLFAKTTSGMSCFLLDDASLVEQEAYKSFDLTRSGAHLKFDDAPVTLLGAEGGAMPKRECALKIAALCIAAEQAGAAERSLEIAVEHAKARKQFGAPIGSFQAIKHRCADTMVAVEAASTTGLHAAWAMNEEIEPQQPWASFAKTVCVEASVKAAASMIQVLGGLGFTWEHPAHLYYRRAVASRQSFGSTRMHRERIAEALLAAVPDA